MKMFLNAEVEVDAFKFANSVCDEPVKNVMKLIREIVTGAANVELDKALFEYAKKNYESSKDMFVDDYE